MGEVINSKMYPYDPDKIFDILIEVVGESGFHVERIEKPIKRIVVSTGISLLSWGEMLEIIVSPERRGALVYVSAKRKVPWNISADLKRKSEHVFEMIDAKLRES